MTRRFLCVLALVAMPALCAPDPRATFDLLNKGKSLSPQDAEKLEATLRKKPNDRDARIELLSYYSTSPPGIDVQALKQARLGHILWLIENDPKEGLGLFQLVTGVYRLNCTGDNLADPEGFKRASDLWLEQVKKNPGDASVRREAVNAIQYCLPEQAEQLLLEAQDRSGLGALYANAVLGVTGQSYSSNDPVGSDQTFRERPFAHRARKSLEDVTDKEFVVTAATTLLREGAILWANGKLDWDYTPLGNSLLTRAKEMAPEAMMLLTLPTTLPASGERPPAILRVGGNVQAANIVRKVTPSYPTSARELGIQGVVLMTALIGLDGRILYLRPESGPAELVPASLEAVRQWQYRPTHLNGKPCYVLTKIAVNFTLSH